jgi:hypothetical protein
LDTDWDRKVGIFELVTCRGEGELALGDVEGVVGNVDARADLDLSKISVDGCSDDRGGVFSFWEITIVYSALNVQCITKVDPATVQDRTELFQFLSKVASGLVPREVKEIVTNESKYFTHGCSYLESGAS